MMRKERQTLSKSGDIGVVVEGACVLVRRPLQQEDGVDVVIHEHCFCARHFYFKVKQ